MEYSLVIKGGRLTRKMGNHLNGHVVHAVPGKEVNGWWGTPAFCGATPSKGYGWIGGQEKITCPRCQKKLEQE